MYICLFAYLWCLYVSCLVSPDVKLGTCAGNPPRKLASHEPKCNRAHCTTCHRPPGRNQNLILIVHYHNTSMLLHCQFHVLSLLLESWVLVLNPTSPKINIFDFHCKWLVLLKTCRFHSKVCGNASKWCSMVFSYNIWVAPPILDHSEHFEEFGIMVEIFIFCPLFCFPFGSPQS